MSAPPTATVRRRIDFWERVVPEDDCWIWTGPMRDGYGRFGKESIPAHRYAYQEMVGPIPAGLELDHLVCSRKACVNPYHCDPVPHRVNTRRWADTITHCPRDHEYTEENTYVDRRGLRRCRACRRKPAA